MLPSFSFYSLIVRLFHAVLLPVRSPRCLPRARSLGYAARPAAFIGAVVATDEKAAVKADIEGLESMIPHTAIDATGIRARRGREQLRSTGWLLPLT
jgi:hypothetical protein